MSLVVAAVVIAWGVYYTKEQYLLYQKNQTDLQNPLFVEDMRTQIMVDTLTVLIVVGVVVYSFTWVLKQAAPQFPQMEEVGFLPRSYRHRMIYGD